MSHQILDHYQIDTSIEKASGESAVQIMCRNIRQTTGVFRTCHGSPLVCIHDLPDRSEIHRLADHQITTATCSAPEQKTRTAAPGIAMLVPVLPVPFVNHRLSHLYPGIHGITNFTGHEHKPFLVSLADQPDFLLVQRNVLQFDIGDFGTAQPAAQKQSEYRIIPKQIPRRPLTSIQ